MQNEREFKRKLVHAIFGVSAFTSATLLGTEKTIALVLLFALAALCAIHLRNTGMRILPQLFSLEREGVMHGKGAVTLIAGVLAALSFAPSHAPAILLVLGVSDAVATLAGMSGRKKLPWNSGKSVRGFSAFFLTAAPICIILLPFMEAIQLALLLSIVESLPHFDDNLSIPFAGVLFALLSS